MPERESRRRGTRNRRQRRLLLALFLIPVAGCSMPWGGRGWSSFKPGQRSSFQTVARETEVIAAAPQQPLFRSAAYRMPSKTVSQRSVDR